jgi:nucleotidyltransferase substrate binding protein (TIGR01987 family)
MTSQDCRWKQRFNNFEKAFGHLRKAQSLVELDMIQSAGLIRFFEMSFELEWNVLKDYLEEQGFDDVKTPRNVIKKAFEIGLIEDGHLWMLALEDRNLMSHTYDEESSNCVVKAIREKYFPFLNTLYVTLKDKVT